MSSELYSENCRVNKGIISTTTVLSRIQCLQQCKRVHNCQGMNVQLVANTAGASSNTMKCQLTSIVVNEDNEKEFTVKDSGWEFHKALYLPRYFIKVVSNANGEDTVLKSSTITVNGKSFNIDQRGLNVLDFDNEKGLSKDDSPKFIDLSVAAIVSGMLNKIENGMTVVAVVHDFATVPTPFPATLFQSIGAAMFDKVKYRQPYCLISMKGHTVAWKKEAKGRENTGDSITCQAMI
eukprot:gene18235-20054_t